MNTSTNTLLIYSALFGCLVSTLNTTANADELDSVRGVIKASKEAVIGVEFSAKVIETPVQTGDSFVKDDILLVFDCEAMEAEQRAAQAAYQAARITHKNNLELQSYGAIGDIEVGVSEAKAMEAKAISEVASVRPKDCVISAPYNGKVAELSVNNFEIPSVNQPLMKIVGRDELELRLIIPSNWLSWMTAGHQFSFDVDETGSSHKAVVSQIGAEVDAVSRTVSIVARFVEKPETILPGMSGNAVFDDASRSAAVSQ